MNRKTRKTIEKYLYDYEKNKKENEKWNNIIKNRLNNMNKEERDLINLRYFKKKKIKFITYELFMSKNRYFSILDNILTEIGLDAAYHHLIERK